MNIFKTDQAHLNHVSRISLVIVYETGPQGCLPQSLQPSAVWFEWTMLIVAFQARVESSSIPENNANTLVSASSQPSTNVLYCTHCMPFYSEEQSVITCQHGVDVLGDIVLSVNTTMLKVFNLSFCHWLKWSFIILEIRLLSFGVKIRSRSR